MNFALMMMHAGMIRGLKRLVYLAQRSFVPVKQFEPSPLSLHHPVDVQPRLRQ